MKTYGVIRVSNQNTSFDVVGGEVKIGKDNNGSYVIINDKKIYGLSRIEHICQIKVANNEEQDKLKALEIIENKEVNVGNFIYWLKRKPRTYEDYTYDFYQEQWYLHYKDNNDDRCKFFKLTEEEFNLLKEVML